jgi:hypothetical protein
MSRLPKRKAPRPKPTPAERVHRFAAMAAYAGFIADIGYGRGIGFDVFCAALASYEFVKGQR